MTFELLFEKLTGNAPFPWQKAMYDRFISETAENIPSSCSLPTGLGKTSVVAIWLIALAHFPDRIPRRLVYVVNRRTVVDQTTAEVESYRERLLEVTELAGIREQLVKLCALPFNFDSDLGAQGGAIDVGFSFDPLAGSALTRIESMARPALELLAFIGLQRFRPEEIKGENAYSHRLSHHK